MSTADLASWVALDGCFNFRDLGAYRTDDGRQMISGRVYRSDGLQHLTPRDIEHLCGERGLGEVIDLRSHAEIEEYGRGPIEARTRIHQIPLFPDARAREGGDRPFTLPANMGDLYFMMLTAAREPIVEVLRHLARAESPIVFHCAAGKDRTGMISALILSLLGVPEDTIVADYAFSRQNIDQINERLSTSATYQAMMQDLPDGAYDAAPEAMRTYLDRVRAEHGGMVAWAAAAGIDDAERTRLRDRLTRPA